LITCTCSPAGPDHDEIKKSESFDDVSMIVTLKVGHHQYYMSQSSARPMHRPSGFVQAHDAEIEDHLLSVSSEADGKYLTSR